MELYMFFVWIGVIVLAVFVEAITVQFVSIWFVGGGVAGLIANALHILVWSQVLIAAVVTLILLICTRPLVNKKLQPKKVHTNADRYIEEIAVVLEEICNIENRGLVKVQGSVWSARSEHPQTIAAGSLVRVLRIEGVKLIVTLQEMNAYSQIK